MKQFTQTQLSTRTAKINPLKAALAASFLAVATTAAFGAEPESTDCDPQFLAMRTEFPAPARFRGAHGVVRVDMKLDAEGRAKEARVTQSSGRRILDRAVINSIRKNWRFDIAQCSPADLATIRTVDVQFLPPIGKSLSNPIVRQAAETTQDLLARNRCDVVQDAHDTIYSCVADSSREMAGKAAALIAPKQT